MLTLIFFMIPVAICIVVAIRHPQNEGLCFAATLIGNLCIILGIIIPVQLHGTFYIESTETNLLTLKDNSNIEGKWFLFGGYIHEKEYFYFYEERPNGGYKLDKLIADKCTVYEEDRDNGILLTISRFPNHDNKWAFDSYVARTYEFHIPVGSISREFNLDAE